MDYKYICAGNVMLDKVRFLNGEGSDREHIGGPATFAYSGIKLWTDEVIQCSNVGKDYEKLFLPWMKKNDVSDIGFKVICDRCNHHIMDFVDKSGKYVQNREFIQDDDYWLKNDAWQDFGYMKTKPEEIEKFTKNKNVKGLYLAQNADRTFWNKLGKIKQRDGFKMMWEIEAPWSFKHYLNDVKEICRDNVDIFSINIDEAQNLFECEGDEECIINLQNLEVDYTLFRVGSRGLYVVSKNEALYLEPAPSKIVDPTGCGNTSTGAALFAYAEGMDALNIGLHANVAASQNIRQYGIIPDFAKVRKESIELLNSLYKKYREAN